MPAIELLFLGTGTSAGIPMIGCACAVCTSDDPRDRRSRPSVVISCGQTRVLVDTAPELRLQCIACGVNRIDAVVFTHAHADHIMGLDDVRRFNTLNGTSLDVFADPPTFQILQQAFGYAFRQPDPREQVYRPHLVHHPIEREFVIGPMRWTPIALFHGRMPVLGFRVGRLAYCTDVSRIPDASWGLLEGLDVLVIDGLQFSPHPTHLCIDQAVEISRRLAPRRTLLTHIAHQVSHAAASARLPQGVELAYDGLRIIADD